MGLAPAHPQSLRDVMHFRKDWRAYQSRLLGQIDRYLDNKRLHVVAAPGSGKTILGLEVIRRVNQSTLVLTPTITIRDQWVDRLVDLFLPIDSGAPEWISTDLRSSGLLTISTYQALHAACSNHPEKLIAAKSAVDASAKNELETHEDGEEEIHASRTIPIPDFIIQAKFRTLVLDEAHHLRAEWWRVLSSLTEQLEDPTVIALTATPPYDVSPFEWQRYQELCGPVDAKVSVPELVQAGDLCPHQDYVFFSTPSFRELKVITDFRTSVDRFVVLLRANEAFSNTVLEHPWVSAPDQHTEEILADPEYLSSMLIYLNAVGKQVPRAALKSLGLSYKKIPALELQWLETLLSHCFYSDAENFRQIEPTLKALRHELLRIGAIERRKVKLRELSDHLKLLTTSVTKLKSTVEIVKLEADALGSDLRCVVLTDFIRKAELPTLPAEEPVFEDIGIVPVFETLRRANISNIRLGVLSGSLVVVPTSEEPVVRQSAENVGIHRRDLSIIPLPHEPAFSTVEVRGEYLRGAVRLITAVFEQGGITVLIGTKSLLGEGWDAPCINTLVLASFVGSSMLSNQMRGRAIRVNGKRQRKTANIWHWCASSLVCSAQAPTTICWFVAARHS